jgi:ribosome-associated heat shock protein Hsp15
MKPDDAAIDGRVRLDKWLWAARFYKTRTLAAEAIDAGQVRVNGDRAKPARAMRTGDRVAVRKQGIAWDIEVIALSDRRGGAADAAKLYREGEESVKAREAEIARRRAAATNASPWSGRPTKRQRRKLEEFLDEG